MLPPVMAINYDGIRYFRMKQKLGCIHGIFKTYDAG